MRFVWNDNGPLAAKNILATFLGIWTADIMMALWKNRRRK